MHKLTPVSVSLLILFIISTGPALAESVDARLDRIEQLMGNQVLTEQLQQMDLMRQELTELRELVEGQEHQLTLIKQRQRNLYQDMDRRLQNLEAGSVRSSSAGSNVSSLSASNVAPPVSAADMNAASLIEPPLSESDAASDTDGKSAYSQAFNVLKEGDYAKAISKFKTFMQAYYASRDYKSALQVFQGIVISTPNSSKALDAELKIGYTYYAMQDWTAARQTLEGLIAKHPDAKRSVEKANKRLERMKREGH